jgi:hypothetical protein
MPVRASFEAPRCARCGSAAAAAGPARFARMAICVIVMLAAASLLAACGDGGSGRAPAPPVSLLVSQASASVPARSREQFTASVQNDPANMGVVWSVHGTACNGGPCGTIDNPNANPVTYSAPAQVPSPATETLVATAVANGNASASVAITVTAEFKVSVPAASAEVPANTSQQFAASVQNDLNNQGIVWSLRGAACNGGPCGQSRRYQRKSGHVLRSGSRAEPVALMAARAILEIWRLAIDAAVKPQFMVAAGMSDRRRGRGCQGR